MLEFFRHVIQFALKRIDIGNLIGARFSFVTENRSVKLVGMFTQPFFACDCSSFGCSYDFFAHRINLPVEIGDVFAERIAFWQVRAALNQRLSQTKNSIHQHTFIAKQSMDSHRRIEL